MEKIKINAHSSIRIADGKTMYFDPYEIKGRFQDADFIFITHDHYDHLDVKSIANVIRPETRFICPKGIVKTLVSDAGIRDSALVVPMDPGDEIKLCDEVSVKAIPAYNVSKPFHKKDFNWLGYIVNANGTTYYVAGDTDITDEAKQVKCDVAIVPIGGTYTMDYKEAAELVNFIKPKTTIPSHYGSVVGEYELGLKFAAKVNDGIDVELLIKKEEKIGRGSGCGGSCGGGCGSGCR